MGTCRAPIVAPTFPNSDETQARSGYSLKIYDIFNRYHIVIGKSKTKYTINNYSNKTTNTDIYSLLDVFQFLSDKLIVCKNLHSFNVMHDVIPRLLQISNTDEAYETSST